MASHIDTGMERVFNYSVTTLHNEILQQQLKDMHRQIDTAYRVKVSLGYILAHQSDGELRYYHPDTNNHLFDTALAVSDGSTLNAALESILHLNVEAEILQGRPDTEWHGELATQVT